MYQRLDARLVQMSDVRGRLTSFLTGHDGLRVDRPESVDDHLASNGLDGVDDDCDGSGVELFKGLGSRVHKQERVSDERRRRHLTTMARTC
jgi:hypothetical protein